MHQIKYLLFSFFLVASFFVISPSFAEKPCKTASKGMVCIKGGSFQRGSAALRNAKPVAEVSIPTFYMDKTEVSNQAYKACVDAGYCFHPGKARQRRSASRPTQPVTFVSWFEAQKYCHWVGKRLPTEMEWEFSARGSKSLAYASGNEKPSCKEMHTRSCSPRRPKNVSQGQANAQGLFHLGGNVQEWVQDWYSPCFGGCRGACGEACQGKNPKGLCSGREGCQHASQKVVKGASYNTSKRYLLAANRGKQDPQARTRNIGFRCASSVANVQKVGKPLQIQSRKDLPVPTKKLSPAKHRLFWNTPEDNLKEKKLCPRKFRSGSNCRDPISYVKSNEQHAYLFIPYIKNLGGAYVGIGADQNYNFIAWARSRFAWLMDYDPIIPLIHKIHRAFILRSTTGKAFVEHFTKAQAKASLKLLRKVYAKDKQRVTILRAYALYRKRLHRHFMREFRRKNKERHQYWVVIPKHYNYIRRLFQLERIRMMPGDLLKFKSLNHVGLAAQKMGVKVKAMYFSNAEEYWFYPKHFRKHIAQMPLADDSVIIRTLSHPRWGTKKHSYFHYNIHHARSYKASIAQKKKGGWNGYLYRGIKDLGMIKKITGAKPNITYCSLPTKKK